MDDHLSGDERTAAFISSLRWADLPDPVRRKAKMCLVDNAAALLAGTPTRISQISAEYAARLWRGDEASIVLHGKRSTAAGAAFANGNSANAIDSDDSARYAYGHAGAQLFPTVLALAEARELSGQRLLTGLVVGYEVAHRIGRCWHDDHTVYQACGSWGSVACAAAAAHLLDLPADQARHALGIADYHAPNAPMMRDIEQPAMVKHAIGWGAMTGVMSAELAACGYTGVPSLLSHEKYAAWVDDIGQNYLMVDGVAWKAKGFACCGWAHAASEGAKRLVDQYHLQAEEIDRIHIETFHNSMCLGTNLPTTTEEAQFNLAWPVAAMLADGEIGPAQTLESRLSDPRIRGLAARVAVSEAEDLNELCDLFQRGDPRGRFASRVTVTTTAGRVYESGLVGGGLSFPQAGWDERVMDDKFRWLAATVLEAKRIDRLAEMLWHFDEVANVREFTRLVG